MPAGAKRSTRAAATKSPEVHEAAREDASEAIAVGHQLDAHQPASSRYAQRVSNEPQIGYEDAGSHGLQLRKRRHKAPEVDA
eukprot:CAMPEP_0175472496 /NCGR_PEP_ID=MMETSP0095-20121207/73899_1 /TAXON_ID=311494 /ORGANISM="Alexandrium monilatum, Strain CCMP3105" /LENGTH=81 /DNA_ID=CAMNT_0016773969 /DNA_START=59 /DNA_END=304 /DNA_ORIENTATION=+